MIELFLVATLSTLNLAQVAGISPCVWPKCVKPVEVAQIQPCIWPKCNKPDLFREQLLMSSDIETCQWPKKCASATL